MKKLILTLSLSALAIGLMAGDTGSTNKKDAKAAQPKACCAEKADPTKGTAAGCPMKQGAAATCPMKQGASCNAKQMATAKNPKVLKSPKAAAEGAK
jgi:hypothetical protein